MAVLHFKTKHYLKKNQPHPPFKTGRFVIAVIAYYGILVLIVCILAAMLASTFDRPADE